MRHFSSALLIFSLACADKSGVTDDTGAGGDDTSADDTGGGSGAYSLNTCTTSFGSGVPAFFSTFFQCVTVTHSGGSTTLTGNGLPPHASPYYEESDPNWEAWDARGGDWHQNPNQISTQSISVTIEDEPVSRGLSIGVDLVDGMAATSQKEYGGPVTLGLALDGVSLFHGVAAPGDDISQERYSFDTWEGHPQDSGVYHHHSANPAALSVLEHLGFTTTNTPGAAELELYGIMCDGTVVMGCTELDGSTPDSGDFDAQNGHVHDLVGEDGTVYWANRYHTHLCEGVYDDEYTPEIQYYEGCQ